MNKTLKNCLEVLMIAIITVIIAFSSPLNPWIDRAMTQVQTEIFDIAYSVREGFLAYVELDGHYGPVIYEFFGLGYLPTDTHVVHFIMETVIIFIAVLFLYLTAKLFTSEIMAMIATAIITIFGWGALTSAGAEEILFVILALTGYHSAKMLTERFYSHHTYLLAIDMGLVFFIQPGYVFIWIALVLFFGIKFKLDKIEKKYYRNYWFSIIEGIATVVVPMGLYLLYFDNAQAFLQQVVVYNMTNIGGLIDGLAIICGSYWVVCVVILIVVMIIEGLRGKDIKAYCYWLGFIIIAMVVIALQKEKLDSYAELIKALYIVPLASVGAIIDKPLGLKKDA